MHKSAGWTRAARTKVPTGAKPAEDRPGRVPPCRRGFPEPG